MHLHLGSIALSGMQQGTFKLLDQLINFFLLRSVYVRYTHIYLNVNVICVVYGPTNICLFNYYLHVNYGT